MKILNSHISIGKLQFSWVASVDIVSSWQLFTDTAEIKLPAHLKINKDELLGYLNFGDKVQIKLGYDDDLKTVFKGYVTDIEPGVPVTLKCEDEMWRLKQESITASARKMSVKKLLNQYYTGYKHRFINIELGAMVIDNLNKVKVLEQLKGSFGLYAFFRGDTLYVGKQYDTETARKHRFVLDYNIAGDSLAFKRKEQVRLKVKAIANQPDGSKLEITLGDDDGDTRTLNFYNLTKAELKKAAERELERLKYDGWRGSFTAFGQPLVRHGDVVRLEKQDQSKDDKTGNYFVDKVSYHFGTDGFRQKISLGPKA